MQAVRKSSLEAKDPANAGMIFVEDYCYYMWWLASAQSSEPAGPSPANHLLQAHLHITPILCSNESYCQSFCRMLLPELYDATAIKVKLIDFESTVPEIYRLHDCPKS